ncbi:MAG: methyltransferase family protein [Terriglobia bacterium]
MKLLYWMDAVFFLCFGVYVVAQTAVDNRYIIGIGMAIFGFALWVMARIQLGESFSVTAQAKALVTTGLYSKIRHPIYFFAGIAFLGLFIAWGKLIPLVVFLAVYPIQIFRIKKEEAVLEQEFGEEYRRYQESTWF